MIKIYSFNEWKESDGYNVQKWFITKKIEIEKWFDEDILNELKFQYFEFEPLAIYGLYSAELYFSEKTIEWILQILIDSEKITDGVKDLKLVFKGYNIDSQELIGQIDRDAKEDELNADLILELINEFKIQFVDNDDEVKTDDTDDNQIKTNNINTDNA